jgi:hypothetical protein
MIARPEELAIPTDIDAGATVPLVKLAWARSGDKGDLFNVGCFAREPGFFPYIAAALDAATVGEWFAHFLADPDAPKVERYLLPGTHGLNFVVPDSLGGGGSHCARIDPVAKSMAQILLEYEVPVSRDLAARLG